jgi:hypothetical protein
MVLCVLKSVVAWVVLTFVGTNLIGFAVRGILESPPQVEAPDERTAEVFRHESRRASIGNAAVTLLSILAAAAYLFALFYFWNVWLALAAAILKSLVGDTNWSARYPTTCRKGPSSYCSRGHFVGDVGTDLVFPMQNVVSLLDDITARGAEVRARLTSSS